MTYTLPAALAALAEWPQFILWKLDDRGTKLPVSPRSGAVCDAHNPAEWCSYAEAQQWSAHRGYGLAFVLTAADPFFCLDLDACRTLDGWSPFALAMCASLPGCAVEVSQSGNGLHLWGRAACPPHRKRAVKPYTAELYTELRFIAFGGAANGDARTDCTAALSMLVAQYFPPGGEIDGSDDPNAPAWVDQASEEWRGPVDDDELIALMTRGRATIATVLQGKASPADLWSGNVEALSRAFPDPTRMYDASSADAALAAHLAFWTGRNSERIRRLMLRSALVRDKWTEHRSYLWRTVSKAIAGCRNVYVGSLHVVGGTAAAAVPNAPAAPVDVVRLMQTIPRNGSSLMPVSAQPDHFAGCIYVRDLHRVFTPDGALLKPEQFKAMKGGYTFAMDVDGERTTRNAYEAFTESQCFDFPKVEQICFRPEIASGATVEEENRRMLNVYVPIETPRKVGDAAPFLRHIAKLLPDARDQSILTSYLAALVQYPGRKFQWCPVLQGAEGNGKTVIIRTIAHAVGNRYTHLPNAQDLGGNGSKFNEWIQNKLFIGVEEITLAERADILDALKPMITNDRIEIQGKGKDQITGDNRANFLMCCNPKEAIAVGVDKRRYCIFYTAQQSTDDLARDGMAGGYFPELYTWLRAEGYAIVNEYLRTYAIPDEFNPAGLCQRAPSTSSTAEMTSLSLGPIEQEIVEAIGEERAGFCGGWISSLALEKLLQERGGAARRISHQRRRSMLSAMGYDLHPHLPDGRVSQTLVTEGGRPRLFVKRGHLALSLTTQAAIVEAYQRAQGAMAPTAPSLAR